MADATTYYAWTRFMADINEWGMINKWINVGDKVTKADLKVGDAEFQELIDIGSLREQPYPQALLDGTYGGSPSEYFKDQLVRASAGELTASEVKELNKSGVQVDVATTATMPDTK